MKQIVYILWFVLLIQKCFAPPVTQNVKKDGEEPDSDVGGLEDYMEYHRYLKEVVNALESDPDFRNKLEKASEDEIRSGKIADQLEFVSHHVRTRLDEIKRVELQRLKELTEKKRRLENDVNVIDNEDPLHHHLDHNNPHSFEIEDLKKLIAKTTEDLAEADKKRKEDFKRYEMEKEYQMQDKLNHTNGTEREQLEKEYKEMAEKHKKHEKLHEPGHKAQLEEVWQEQDQMQQDFNPKTFFMLHDIDGNGLWDQEEVKALFIKELDKMYQEGAPEDDMRERVEEMERMRESVFDEMDKNRDGFIDFQEFLQQTNTNDFKQDHGWQGIDERKPYTDEELQEYIRMHHANQIPPQYYQQGMPQMPPGAYQQVPPGYHPNAVPSGGQFHPGQVPQSPPQALHGSQGYLNTNEIYPDQQQYHQQPNYQQQYQPPPPPGYQQYPNPPVGQQQQYQQAQHLQQQNPQANQQQQFQQAQHPQAGQQQQYQQAQHPQASQQQAQNQQQQQYQQGQNAQQQQQQQYQPPPPQAAVPQAGQQQQPQQNQQVPQQNQHVQGQPVEHVAQQNQAAQQQVPV